ncbi:MAG: nitroreductase family protein [Collinsella aerofaciens]
MNEQVCTKAVDTCGYPVETTGNAVLDTLEHRSSTRAFARDDDDRPVAVTDEQRAAILHAASRAPSAGAMMMYSIVSIREQATLDRLADLCDHQPMIAKAPWALIFVVDYAKWIDLFEHVGCFEPEFVERTGKAPRRAPGLGDFAIAAQDAVIAAQNAVVAAEAQGWGAATSVISSRMPRKLPSCSICRPIPCRYRCSSSACPVRSVRPLRILW